MRRDINYSPTDCLETFPFPLEINSLTKVGESYFNFRKKIMEERIEGLTKIYNRFHDHSENELDIGQLRSHHILMDNTVMKAYGWTDIELDHGFHNTPQGTRFTICDKARNKILDRLLTLNHERYVDEVSQGLHDKKKNKSTIIKALKENKKKNQFADKQMNLFS